MILRCHAAVFLLRLLYSGDRLISQMKLFLILKYNKETQSKAVLFKRCSVAGARAGIVANR